MRLDILIVAYRAKQELSDTLASIALWTSPGYRLTVYDNTVTNYPLTWIWNRFIEQSPREAIALVNPDVIVGPGWDRECMDCLKEDQECASAMPLTNQPSHKPFYPVPQMGDRWTVQMPLLVEELRTTFPNRFHVSKDRTMVTGHCMVLRKSSWAQISGFDDKSWPFGNNDYDFNDRALRAGMRLGVSLHSAVSHRWGSSSRDAKASGAWTEGKSQFTDPPQGLDFQNA